MKSDFFRRGVRFIHKFGETEKLDNPLSMGTFAPPDFPLPGSGVERLSGTGYPCEIQEKGEYAYRPQASPIQKPSGGMASINGPEPDVSQILGMPIPVGTKRRLGPPKTDK